MWEALIGEAYREEAIGMTVRGHWTEQDAWVFHSEWWLREHWDGCSTSTPSRLRRGPTWELHR